MRYRIRSLTFIPLVALLTCGGCSWLFPKKVDLDLDYANTSLGFRNSGAFSPGRLYLWDQDENKLVVLSSDIPLSQSVPSTPSTLKATSVTGFSIEGKADVVTQFKADIEAEVKKKLNFSAENASRIDATGNMGAMTKAYRNLHESDVNAFTAWRVGDATDHPEHFKYVLLTDVVTASEESIDVSGEKSGGLGISVADEWGADIRVKIPKDVSASCSGERAVCYFDAVVYKVFLNEKNNLDYEPVGFSKEKLSQAFKK